MRIFFHKENIEAVTGTVKYWRRDWDSNPGRAFTPSPVFRTGSLNHSDTSPNLLNQIFNKVGGPEWILTTVLRVKAAYLRTLDYWALIGVPVEGLEPPLARPR